MANVLLCPPWLPYHYECTEGVLCVPITFMPGRAINDSYMTISDMIPPSEWGMRSVASNWGCYDNDLFDWKCDTTAPLFPHQNDDWNLVSAHHRFIDAMLPHISFVVTSKMVVKWNHAYIMEPIDSPPKWVCQVKPHPHKRIHWVPKWACQSETTPTQWNLWTYIEPFS